MVRGACGLIILMGLSISSCAKREPDASHALRSPDQSKLAGVREFQPRGTISGFINVSFGEKPKKAESFNIQRLENGIMGWMSNNDFVVVADEIEYSHLASSYYPSGLYESKTRVIVCSDEDRDCDALRERLEQKSAPLKIQSFPDGYNLLQQPADMGN